MKSDPPRLRVSQSPSLLPHRAMEALPTIAEAVALSSPAVPSCVTRVQVRQGLLERSRQQGRPRALFRQGATQPGAAT